MMGIISKGQSRTLEGISEEILTGEGDRWKARTLRTKRNQMT